MTPPPPATLADIQAKIKRANHHIEDLSRLSVAFDEASQKLLAFKDDPETVERVYYLTGDLALPDDAPLVVADALVNMRAALDYAAYAACFAGGKPFSERQARHIAFPIVQTATDYPQAIASQIQSLPKPDVIKVFEGFEPYRRGKDEWLYILRVLTNTDKHRVSVSSRVAGSMYLSPEGAQDFAQGIPEDLRDIFTDDPTRVSHGVRNPRACKRGDEIHGFALDRKIDKDVTFTFHVGVDDPEVNGELSAFSVLVFIMERVAITLRKLTPHL